MAKSAAIKKILGTAALLAVGFVAGLMVPAKDSGSIETRQLRAQDLNSQNAYHYINPLLSCEIAHEQESKSFFNLKEKIENYIKAQQLQGNIIKASVYFNTSEGYWFDVNNQEMYSPASLFKLPVMVAYYKRAEEDPAILQRKVTYTKPQGLNNGEFFKPTKTLEVGQTYTVDELIRRMIVYSDNETLPFLLTDTTTRKLAEVFHDLNLPTPVENDTGSDDVVSAKTYSRIFRFLYNASYLNREMSEKALGVLADTDFKEGLAAGVPAGVEVAQKFGERAITSGRDANKKGLHNCGMIYHPNYPYLICVMTQGNDYKELANVIKTISSMVYNQVDSVYKK